MDNLEVNIEQFSNEVSQINLKVNQVSSKPYDAFEDLNNMNKSNQNISYAFRQIRNRLCESGIYYGVLHELFEFYQDKNANCDNYVNFMFACSHFSNDELKNELAEERNEIEEMIHSMFSEGK
jgi:small-conductance mechanosensitive channel